MGTLMANARAKAGERQGEGREHEHLHGGAKLGAVQLEQVGGVDPRLGVMGEEDHQDGHQHQHRAQQGEQEELHRRVDPPRAAPDADDEVHGNQHQLPEDVEEEHVQGHEGPQHPHLQQLQGEHEPLDPLLDRLVGRKYGNRREEGGQHHQEQADAVDAQVVAPAWACSWVSATPRARPARAATTHKTEAGIPDPSRS
jgi:hypothetical protein